jgi:hypothetical protein
MRQGGLDRSGGKTRWTAMRIFVYAIVAYQVSTATAGVGGSGSQ